MTVSEMGRIRNAELQDILAAKKAENQGTVSKEDGFVQGSSFQQILAEKSEAKDVGITFSKHAEKRAEERGINMNESLMNDLQNAVGRAREKGAKEVAVIGKDDVFIVNVANNTVVTTMSQEDMRERILTNIDSAVIM